jgi:hypothetical protein
MTLIAISNDQPGWLWSNWIASSTTTKTGLKMCCELDTRTYPKAIKAGDAEMASLNIKGGIFHPRENTGAR